MSGLGVGLNQYASTVGNGFGDSTMGELQDLHKALSADSITGRETDGLTVAGSGAPLKVESLEKNLKVLTYRKSDIALWSAIPKLSAYNTVEEYNRLVDYGAEQAGFTLEGELPLTQDTTYQRSSQLVKFMGTTRAVTHQMTLVRTNIGSAIQQEVNSGTMWILRLVDRALTKGSARLVPAEFNGVYEQHREGYANIGAYTADETVIDLRGNRLSEEVIEEAMRTIIDNFGSANTLFAPPIVLSNFTKFFYDNLRQYAPVANDSTVGRRITHFQSQFGEIGLNFDKFMNRLPSKTSLSAAQSQAPVAPTADAAPVVVAADPSSVWEVADAGDYLYAVTAINRFGESALTNMGAAVTVAAGDSVDLDFSDTGGHPAGQEPTAYRIYRSNEGAASFATATYFPVFEVSVDELAAGYDGAAATLVRDRNRFIPDTDSAFILENNQDIWSFKQLAPLMKMNLALLEPAFRFMVLLYGTPILYQPRKVVRFINIGSRDV